MKVRIRLGELLLDIFIVSHKTMFKLTGLSSVRVVLTTIHMRAFYTTVFGARAV